MSNSYAGRLAPLVALVALMSCGESSSTAPSGLTPTSPSALLAPTNVTYPTLGVATTYAVTGAFHDVIHFTVNASGAYSVRVIGNTQIVGCSGRYCMSPGTLKAIVSSAQLQTALGVPVADINVTASVPLTPGDYLLVVDGTGAGTKRYAGMGNFTVTIRAPVVVVPSCDSVRASLAALGYTDAQIEARVDAMLASTPPGCIDN
ncbi:MAG TPA: hypothetical protein VGP25_03485 [Gemmatimonadaceae bacterium]|jgi:hypothetical protein|nr:hypothetical protein [Gemmatimonadaceae bacterium]